MGIEIKMNLSGLDKAGKALTKDYEKAFNAELSKEIKGAKSIADLERAVTKVSKKVLGTALKPSEAKKWAKDTAAQLGITK
ncbi:hypothetical protein HG717_15850 [Rhodococcus erythropolis]|uniref:hypothetical protein n=1 Tax=Rhodococcus erythropolis TaxID=1833 RepID=UPI001C9B43AD|nr:hypothetical protein [Rhodococcus erythropolis]MBY6385375.1 hypothetical protein [Rhodococcus erythropolis]